MGNKLADLILNSKKARDCGGELVSLAQEVVENKKSEEDEETKKLKEHFSRFREIEARGDMLSISYDSLQLFNKATQEKLKSMDSILWNGLFLSYSDFMSKIADLFSLCDNMSLNIEKSGPYYKLNVLHDAYPEKCESKKQNIAHVINILNEHVEVL